MLYLHALVFRLFQGSSNMGSLLCMFLGKEQKGAEQG